MSSVREKLVTSWLYIWLSQIRHRNGIMRCVPKGLTCVTHMRFAEFILKVIWHFVAV